MIFSEDRFPLFRIMLWRELAYVAALLNAKATNISLGIRRRLGLPPARPQAAANPISTNRLLSADPCLLAAVVNQALRPAFPSGTLEGRQNAGFCSKPTGRRAPAARYPKIPEITET